MNFQDIPAEYQSKTDAELAALLPVLSARPINTSAVEALLRDKGYARRSAFGSQAFVGGLPDLAVNPGYPESLREGLDLFFGYLMTDALEINCHREMYGATTSALLAGLLQLGVFTQDDVDDFYALGGGRPYVNETEQTIAAARVAKESKDVFYQQLTHLMDTYISPAEITLDKTTYVAGLRSAADWLEAQ